MEHELIPVYTKFTGNGVRVQNDSNPIPVARFGATGILDMFRH